MKKYDNTFCFAGNRQSLRTEEELSNINKEEADSAFKQCKKERYGSKTFCVNFAVMPLYCEKEYIVTDLGDRLGTYISGKDVWWDYASENIAKVSFSNVALAIEKYVFP